ncbi:uncharacterized protein LOC101208380 isoform X1 [Cucumis sativus]|uniref:Uncharacterized protein n=1 Tax=Cucumis sativus TaxID=3659 RepID=A0A0A0LAM7_CUCSA|nr:uncharacterized protein LOC101208380 isoform X1 [Cucumis sativus]
MNKRNINAKTKKMQTRGSSKTLQIPFLENLLEARNQSMDSFNNNANMDNLFLQTLMARLQIRPPVNYNNINNPLLSQSLEELIFEAANLSDDDNDDNRTPLAKEESKLEKEIIRVILAGNTDSLKPNSGQAVTVGEHHVCVGFHEEKDSDFRVWEWHGHIMLFDEENGYSPEYIYGNYFERLQRQVVNRELNKWKEEEEEDEKEEEQKEEKPGDLGLRELIDGGDSSVGRILHRNVNPSSQRGRF